LPTEPEGLSLSPEERVPDPDVTENTLLWRLVDKVHWLKRDPQTGAILRDERGQLRISAESFNTHEVSVRISDAISFDALRQLYPNVPIAQTTAAVVLNDGCIVARDTRDRSHALIYDKERPGIVSLRINRARRIISAATIFDPLSGAL